MRRIPKKVARSLMGLLLAAILSVLAYAVVNTYNAYTQMVVQQQEQHLLITSRAVSQNLSLYISEQVRDVDILTRTPGFLREFQDYYDTGEDRGLKEYILSYMLSQQQGISRIYLLDHDGKVIYRYNQYPFLEDFDESVLDLQELSDRRQSGMGTVFRISPKHYGFSLVNGIMSGNDYVGTVVSVLDTERLYQQFIAPLNFDSTGDIVVKNSKGTVIMNSNPDMISFNPFLLIEGLGQLPQYESLNRMLQQQYSQEEGSALYRSYANGIVPPEDEITSFSRANIGGTSWYVSAVVPYSTVKDLVSGYMGRFGLLVAAILAVLAGSMLSIVTLQKDQQKLRMEASYLKDINHTLEELHQSREQVYHYQKLQTIGSLASGIVHEFNNLLTPIMGYSEFLKEQLGPSSDYYEDMDEIYRAGCRAKEIVEQILPFSRRETDSTTYSPVNLGAVLQESAKMVGMILPSGIQLQTDFSALRVNVFGSATQLHQVFLNLCSNASQAMEQTGGVLGIHAQVISASELPKEFQQSAGGSYALVRVSDTGCGISPEVLPHIFDSFFTTKGAGQGTGLGLSMVQNILISHGGFIKAVSTVGVGSDFTVYLPVTELSVQPAQSTPPQPAVTVPNRPILLVDDNENTARYLKRRLSHAGYQVDLYTDPQEALKAFLASPMRWGLLLADNTMPKYKGTALIRRMKQQCAGLPAILMTGLVELDAVQMQRQGLIDEIMVKPLDFSHLLDVMERLM